MKHVLGKYKELEKQQICFSTLAGLNDPMEGFKNIIWEGDQVLWRKYLIGYVWWVAHYYERFVFLHDKLSPVRLDSFSYLKTLKKVILSLADYPTPFDFDKGYDKLVDERWARLLDNHPQILEKCVKLSNYDFNTYLDLITPFVLKQLENIGIVPVQKQPLAADPDIESSFEDSEQLLKGIAKNKTARNKNSFRLPSHGAWPSSPIIFSTPYIKVLQDIACPKAYAACFSENYDNASMWSHYAEQHRGICLKFRVSSTAGEPNISLIEEQSKEELSFSLSKVDYKIRYPEINCFQLMREMQKLTGINENGELVWRHNKVLEVEQSEFLDKLYANSRIKLKAWAHEKEWRILAYATLSYANNKLFFRYNLKDLAGIIFGIETSFEDKQKVVRIVLAKYRREKLSSTFTFEEAYYDNRTHKIKTREIGVVCGKVQGTTLRIKYHHLWD